MRRRCLLFALLLLALASPAAAQGGEPSAADDGKALVQAGADQFADGHYRDAAATWEKSLSLLGEGRGWKLHYNLGLAYGELHDATRAAAHHSAFIERVAQETARLSASLEERREDAAAKLAAIKEDNGAVVLPTQPNAVSVTIDEGEARPVGFTAYLSAGEHRLSLSAADGAARATRVAVSAGQSVRIDTALKATPTVESKPAPAVAPPDAPEPVASEERSFPTVVVLIGVGLTAASFALPGVMWGKAADRFQEAEDLGKGHTGYPDKVEEYDEATTAYYASYALPAALGAITLGVAVYGIIHVSGESSESVSLRVGPGALSLDGHF
jgi:hypothetical protein